MVPLALDKVVSVSLPLKSSLLPSFNLSKHRHLSTKKRGRNGTCRAEFSTEAPIAVAIGACILNSLAFPIASTPEEEGDSVIDSADARFAVMGIISFIPYFNWMSWVFAWLDTGKRRYAVYAIVYFAPYLSSKLSISPEESWLPVASILLCIIHIQLEASIKNGDLQGFQLFNEAVKHLPSFSRKKDGRIQEEERKRSHKNLPEAHDESRDDIRSWGVPRKPSLDSEFSKDGEDDKRTKH